MKALVTGGGGFIGRHLVRCLIDDGVGVTVLDKNVEDRLREEMPGVCFYQCDMMSPTVQWEEILDGVDVVYHLAGMLGTSELFDIIIDAECVNVLGTLLMLEAMRKYGVKKIVYTSKPNVWKYNPYTITKENTERYLRMYHEIYGLHPVILCPYNVYGPEEYINDYRKAVPYFIISAIQNKPIEIYGDGKQTVDLIHVEDAVRAFISASKIDEYIPEKIEIGSGVETVVNDLADFIIELADSKSEIVHIPMRKGEDEGTRLWADTRVMRDVLKSENTIDLHEGLLSTIKHYRDHLERYI